MDGPAGEGGVTYTLYWAPDTGAFVVEAVLEELALPYELVPVDTKRGEHRRPEYLALNPMAQVPVLRLPDGTHLTETAAMVLHLCDGILRPGSCRHRARRSAPSPTAGCC